MERVYGGVKAAFKPARGKAMGGGICRGKRAAAAREERVSDGSERRVF